MRTPGKWEVETVPTSIGRCHKVGPACIYDDYNFKGDPSYLLDMAKLISAAPELLEACKHALRVCESEERYEASDAIKRKALLISELVGAMRKCGLPYKDMTV